MIFRHTKINSMQCPFMYLGGRYESSAIDCSLYFIFRLGYMEVRVALSVLVRKFRFHCVEGQTIEPYYGLITRPNQEIWITAEKRE